MLGCPWEVANKARGRAEQETPQRRQIEKSQRFDRENESTTIWTVLPLLLPLLLVLPIELSLQLLVPLLLLPPILLGVVVVAVPFKYYCYFPLPIPLLPQVYVARFTNTTFPIV